MEQRAVYHSANQQPVADFLRRTWRSSTGVRPGADVREPIRLPSYSPQLSVIERFRELLRPCATPDRRIDEPADLRRSIRASRSSDQAMRGRVGPDRRRLHPPRKTDTIARRVK